MSRPPKMHKPLPFGFGDTLAFIADEQKPTLKTKTAKPFVKWVGGKRSILPELLARVPSDYDTYYEPFLGGGALVFALKPEKAVLSDINFHLILTFQAVRDDVKNLILELQRLEENHNKEQYLKARRQLSLEKDRTKIAALFIYLNKTCYNGLYRVNKSGEFNVPMGSYKNPLIVDEENLMLASHFLKHAEITQSDFTQIEPKQKGFYYIDPPYHETYDGYNGKGFGDKEHTELAEICRKIDKVGGYFMVSNSDTELVRKLYKGYNAEKVSALRSVSCKGYQRKKENELIIRNYK